MTDELNWDQSLEPGAIKIEHTNQRARAEHDAKQTGLGFLIDGARVDPARVVIVRPNNLPLHVTTTDLWKALEQVLRDKGATDAWIEYALPDLQVAATQLASDQWGRGYEACAAGEPMPNPPFIGTPTIVPAMPPPLSADTPEARERLAEAFRSVGAAERGEATECDHDWRYVGTDPRGSHKGEDAYKCIFCDAFEYRD